MVDTPERALVHRFYSEVINDWNLDAIDRLLSVDFVHNGEARGREGQRAAVQVFLDAFDPLHNEILVAPTGRTVSFVSTAILRIANGEIAEATDVVASADLMAQLTD
jgi:hypothetical protein